MKKIIMLAGLFCVIIIHAQIAIGKESVDGDGILDFAGNTTNGILLPIVETLPNDASEGTLLMDKNDKVVKMNTGTGWIPLSDAGSTDNVDFNTNAEVSGPNRVIIGASVSSAPGVLVLESPNKSLILPKIENPHINVKSPYPGMICYDTVSKSLAVFDGRKWNYWK